MVSTAVFDIETSDLAADRGIVLCTVIQSSESKKPVILRSDDLNPGWSKGHRGDDSEVVKRTIKILNEHDVVVAHNGTRFDLPFLRTRAARWHQAPFKDIKTIDPLKIAWNKMRLGRNSLASLQDFLGVKERKTPLDWSLWMRAILDGDRDAMDDIVVHCVADVKVLAGVLDLVKPYIKLLDDRGSSL